MHYICELHKYYSIMKTKRLHYLFTLFCTLALLSACKDDANAPLRFYYSEYEVPIGGRRGLGLQSGNGDYELEIGDTRIATAGTETGWSGAPAGRIIYVSGILTGKTYLKVTDKATQETCTLPIKVVDNYEDIYLYHSHLSSLPNGDPNLLKGIDHLFLMNNHTRDAYFFRQGEGVSITSSGLELITKGNYTLEQETADKATLTLTYSVDETPASEHKFIIWGTPYLFHRLDKNLNLNWGTPSIGETRTSPTPPPSYTLEEVTEGGEAGTGRQISFSVSYLEIPFGILP